MTKEKNNYTVEIHRQIYGIYEPSIVSDIQSETVMPFILRKDNEYTFKHASDMLKPSLSLNLPV